MCYENVDQEATGLKVHNAKNYTILGIDFPSLQTQLTNQDWGKLTGLSWSTKPRSSGARTRECTFSAVHNLATLNSSRGVAGIDD
jgi:hypothetical protein